MKSRRVIRGFTALGAALFLMTSGCATALVRSNNSGPPRQVFPAGTVTNSLEFGISWPPAPPGEIPQAKAAPLLRGRVVVRSESLPDRGCLARLHVILFRDPSEAGRNFWNSRLAFPEYDWMRFVRVWDEQKQWLWPNLPYLLRLHGEERVDRYGGVDPGKGVDNDFAAVLIRKYDPNGSTEDASTQRAPLVAAEWYPVGLNGKVDKQTVVHEARSDEFTLHLGPSGEVTRGKAAVWLIYADFMGARLPQAWPTDLEFAGGILAYFEVDWDLNAGIGRQVSIRNLAPPRSTGFDWERWALRTRTAQDRNTARLSDEPPSKKPPSAVPAGGASTSR